MASVKCSICESTFGYTKDDTYKVSKTIGSEGLFRNVEVYDAVDCVDCGCQILLKIRYPKFLVKEKE